MFRLALLVVALGLAPLAGAQDETTEAQDTKVEAQDQKPEVPEKAPATSTCRTPPPPWSSTSTPILTSPAISSPPTRR